MKELLNKIEEKLCNSKQFADFILALVEPIIEILCIYKVWCLTNHSAIYAFLSAIVIFITNIALCFCILSVADILSMNKDKIEDASKNLNQITAIVWTIVLVALSNV